MNASSVQLILAMIPIAEKIIFEVGGKLVELNTADLTREDMLKALDASRSDSWPELKFSSTASNPPKTT